MKESKTKGIIFDIKRFAIHDGEGIRTTVFIKGCPLRCPWCHNPEGRKRTLDLMWFSSLCVRCGSCIKACNQEALRLVADKIVIDYQKCTHNRDCVQVCPANALKMDGWETTVSEILEEIKKDRIFYREKGGVTLSGGDPLFQPDFSVAILEACKAEEINTAIETCLFADEAQVRRLIPLVDQFFVDIKILDSDTHEKTVGKKNGIILRNFEVLSQADANICVRVPIIPGYTDSDENIRAIAIYVHEMNAKTRIELLNYNPLAENKFDTLNEKYFPGKANPLSESEMERKRSIVSRIWEAK